MKKRKFIPVLAAFCCLPAIAGVHTETPVANVPMEIQSAPQASNDSTEFQTEMQKMLENSGALKTMEAMLPQLRGMMSQTIQAASPDPEQAMQIVDQFFAHFTSEIIDLITPVYRKYYTTDDLKQLNAFYETPIGKKMASTSPLIMTEVQTLSAEYGKNKMLGILQKLQEKGLLKSL